MPDIFADSVALLRDFSFSILGWNLAYKVKQRQSPSYLHTLDQNGDDLLQDSVTHLAHQLSQAAPRHLLPLLACTPHKANRSLASDAKFMIP